MDPEIGEYYTGFPLEQVLRKYNVSLDTDYSTFLSMTNFQPTVKITLGMAPTPPHIRELSFMGEFKNDDQFLEHKLFHEIGHVLLTYEAEDALSQVFPGANPDVLDDYLKKAIKQMRELGRPLSMLNKLAGRDNLPYYTEDALLEEDFAEALAQRMGGEENWRRYVQYICQGSAANRQDGPKIARVIDIIYRNATR